MSVKTRTIFGMILGMAVLSAQVQPSGRDPVLRPYPPDGKLTVHSHPAEEAASLDVLVRMSQLIVDGTVVSVLPAINTNADPNRPDIETHSLIAITKVLKGTPPAGTTTLLLAQQGGKTGKWDVVVEDDPLVQLGERYILFLALDERQQPPKALGTPRYYTVGAYAGKAKIGNGKAQFFPAAHARLREFNNTDVPTLLKVLDDKIHERFIPTGQNLPPHPRPPAKP